jgi:isopentenyl diphosphate isomerase/L-lactate dehydrogenase-like FMN-dependent dehydrogenase
MAMRTNPPFATLDEAEALARRRLPKVLFNRIIEPMAPKQKTLAENTRVFDDVLFRPKAATYIAKRDLSTTVLGTEISFPVLLASPGTNRIWHPDGEKAAAAAAGRAGTIDIAAMGTGHPIEEVTAVASGPIWQQIYLSRGRGAAEELIARSRAVGIDAIVLTVDVNLTPIPASMNRPGPELSWQNAKEYGLDAVRHPRWFSSFVKDQLKERHISDVERLGVMPGGMAAYLRTGEYSDQLSATWEDLTWIREQWNGPIVLKGILSGDDARRAIDVGASAIVVSNHGALGMDALGLDPVSPSLRVLPQIVRACDREIEVLLDSGVRSGADAVKAIALGARAVLIGRPYLMGLAAAGEPGVYQVLEIFRSQIDRVLGGLGCPSVQSLNGSYVEIPPSWPTWPEPERRG